MEAGAAVGTNCNLALGGNKTAAGGGGAVGRFVVRGTLAGTAQVTSPAPDVGPAAKN